MKGKLQIFPKFATVFVNLIQNSHESVILYILAYDYIIYIYISFISLNKKKKYSSVGCHERYVTKEKI